MVEKRKAHQAPNSPACVGKPAYLYCHHANHAQKQVPGNAPATTEKQAVRAQSTQGGTLGVNKEVRHQHNNVRETRRNASWWNIPADCRQNHAPRKSPNVTKEIRGEGAGLQLNIKHKPWMWSSHLGQRRTTLRMENAGAVWKIKGHWQLQPQWTAVGS